MNRFSPYPGHPKQRFVWQLVLGLIDLYAAELLLYFVLRLFTGVQIWQVKLLGEVLHLILLPAILLFFIMLACRLWWRAGALAISVIMFIVLFGELFIPLTGNVSISSNEHNSLTVMTYNVGSSLSDPQVLTDLIRESNADIVGFQEVTHEQVEHLSQLMAIFPYHVLPDSGGTLLLLSKYPISNAEYINAGWEHLYPYIKAHIDFQGKSIQVLVFRGHAPRLGVYAGKGFGYQTWHSGENLMAAEPVSAPMILLADLNTTDQSPDYQAVVDGGLRDAFREAGRGFGLTYPARADSWRQLGSTPFVRIDYIFTTPDMKVWQSWVGPYAGSDHLPVFASITFP